MNAWTHIALHSTSNALRSASGALRKVFTNESFLALVLVALMALASMPEANAALHNKYDGYSGSGDYSSVVAMVLLGAAAYVWFTGGDNDK